METQLRTAGKEIHRLRRKDYPEKFGLFRYGDTLPDDVQKVVDALADLIDDRAHGRDADAEQSKQDVVTAALRVRA